MKIFVTGGAGYIGSHTCLCLLEEGYQVAVFDNFCNSSPEALRRVEYITGRKLEVITADLRDRAAVEAAIRSFAPDAVIHFAGLKSVTESTRMPIEYYENNFVGTLHLLQAMQRCGVNTIVFSSSATVYGEPRELPIPESHPLSATNPYGRTKLFIEALLCDLYQAHPDWRIGILRYFNPVGAHESGLLGEDPNGIPNNLMPYIAQVAVGRLPRLSVWGNDYPTHDGTGVRDYIHVTDLARGHLAALKRLDRARLFTVNLGTGRGYSVIEVIKAFERASGRPIPYVIEARRPGDVAACYADPTEAKRLLGWSAQFDLERMCEDTWRWQRQNPNGYATAS